jgi:AcrR family transcriptional regulator
MGRWEPNARGRLERAALELYRERGFEQTTVAEIAERAGLTKRTFFRHFADKRDVLFYGADALREMIARAVAGAPDSLAPLGAVAAGLEAAIALFEERRDEAHDRRVVITANAELRERELVKMGLLAVDVAEALRGRGVADRAARLTAEAGVAAFKVAFEYWGNEPDPQDLALHFRDALEELKAVTADAWPDAGSRGVRSEGEMAAGGGPDAALVR